MYLPGLLLLMLLLPPLSLQDSHQSESKIAMGEKILPALEKATSYLENRYREFNLDSLVGFLMLKVQLKGVLEKWAHDSDLKFLTVNVEEILKRLSVIIPRTKVFLKIVNLKYLEGLYLEKWVHDGSPALNNVIFNVTLSRHSVVSDFVFPNICKDSFQLLPLHNLVKNPYFLNKPEFQETLQPEFWKLPLSWSHTNLTMIYSKFDTAHPFLEKSSDSCMTLLLGTKEKNGQPCKVTDFCKGIMTAPGKSDEELVKQLFYFLIAKMKGCSGDMFLKSKYYMDIFCANMMELNLEREKNGFSFQNKGLFMTNIMLCGFSGYSDFYKIHWIKSILTWQNSKEGCYWKIFVIGNQPLMRNNQLEGGCSSLNTAVAVVSLGGFLYYSADHSLTI